MIFDLWDIVQQIQINEASRTAGYAKDTSRSNSDRIHQEVQRLEAKIDTLAIISQALWEVVREKTGLTEKDIEARIAEIDIRDGRKDGKITGKPTQCPACERPTHTRLKACPYCGTSLIKTHIVE